MNHWIGCAPCLSNRRVVAVVAATSMLAALVAYLTEAIADDSSATLGAGGLELTKAADIRMAAEDLYLSPNAVKLRYEFTNDGPKDVDTVVAFPLPDIDTSELYLESIGTVSNDPINFVDFRVMADGQSIPVQVEQRAFLGNRDVTDIVKSVGLPINVILANDTPLDKLAPAKKRILERAGLAEAEGSDQERPKWVVRTKFYWTQHFPAGKTIIIEHSYKPVTGQTFFTPSDLRPQGEKRPQLAAKLLYGWPHARRDPPAHGAAQGSRPERRHAKYLFDGLHPHDRKQLEGWDRQISPDHRQAEAEQHNLVVLERRPEEDGADPF